MQAFIVVNADGFLCTVSNLIIALISGHFDWTISIMIGSWWLCLDFVS